MTEAEQHNHRRVAAILFALYGLVNLAVIGFVWLIVLVLAREGYFDVFRELKTLTLVAMTLSVVVLPLVSGYALFRIRSWAKGAVWLTCLAMVIASFIVLRQLTSPALSFARVIFGALYTLASLTICIVGLSVVRVKRWHTSEAN